MRPVVATLWIHRAEASGILVHCSSNEDAYKLSCEFVDGIDGAKNSPWDYLTFPDVTEEGRCFHSSSTPNVQISVHPGSYVPAPFWNERGTVCVPDYEALHLGEQGEPDGFEPEESSAVWTKEKRNHAELDDELADYFRLGQIELKEVHDNLLKYAGIYGDIYLSEMFRSRDLEALKSELQMAKDLYTKMTEEQQLYTDRLTLEIREYFLRAGA